MSWISRIFADFDFLENTTKFEELEGESLKTGKQSLTDPSLIYVVGGGGDLLTTYDPANYADVFDAMNQILEDVPDDDQVTIQLPYTGESGIEASTTFDVPDAQTEPNVEGWGEYGTVINYTATDGTPAMHTVNAGNEVGPDWCDFAVIGPGKSAAGDGHGIHIEGTLSHGQDWHGLRVESFPGVGFKANGWFTGTLRNCQIQHNGIRGLEVERLNAGTIESNLIQRNGNAKGNEQVLLWDCIGGTFRENIVDSRGGDTGTLARVDGIVVENRTKRGSPRVVDNYLEDNTTHVIVQNAGTPVANMVIRENDMHNGETGVHIVSDLIANGGRGGIVDGNLFDSLGTQDILLDGGDIVLGPNSHKSTTTVVTDNTGGDFASPSKTSGSYPW